MLIVDTWDEDMQKIHFLDLRMMIQREDQIPANQEYAPQAGKDGCCVEANLCSTWGEVKS